MCSFVAYHDIYITRYNYLHSLLSCHNFSECQFCINSNAFQAQEQVKKLEQSTEDEVESTFSSIVGQKKKNRDDNSITKGSKALKRKVSENNENQTATKTKKVKKSQDFRDKDFYIPYTKDNVFAEEGWDSISILSCLSPIQCSWHHCSNDLYKIKLILCPCYRYSLGSSFQKEAEASQLDLVQDDEALQRKTSALHKWDRQKKKFVGTQVGCVCFGILSLGAMKRLTSTLVL